MARETLCILLALSTWPAIAAPIVVADSASVTTSLESYVVFDRLVGDTRQPIINSDFDSAGETDGVPSLAQYAASATSLAISGPVFATATSTASLIRERSVEGLFRATGEASATWNQASDQTARAYSLGTNDAQWYLAFSLLTAHNYVLDYTLTCCGSNVVMYYRSPVGDVAVFDLRSIYSSPPVSTAGQVSSTLIGGFYTLVAYAPGNFGATVVPGQNGSRFDFAMQLTPIPLPASAWLLASGVLCLFNGRPLRRSFTIANGSTH